MYYLIRSVTETIGDLKVYKFSELEIGEELDKSRWITIYSHKRVHQRL